MITETDGNKIIIQLDKPEKDVLLKYYSGMIAIAIAIRAPVQEWIDARIRISHEAQMRELAEKFNLLSTDDQLEVMNILNHESHN